MRQRGRERERKVAAFMLNSRPCNSDDTAGYRRHRGRFFLLFFVASAFTVAVDVADAFFLFLCAVFFTDTLCFSSASWPVPGGAGFDLLIFSAHDSDIEQAAPTDLCRVQLQPKGTQYRCVSSGRREQPARIEEWREREREKKKERERERNGHLAGTQVHNSPLT